MPAMKSLFSDTQVEQLISFVEKRSGKSGLLRYAGQLYAKHVVLDEPGLPAGPTPASRARTSRSSRANDDSLNPPAGQLEEAPNLAQIDRGYWLSGNPLPVTEQNLLRGKEVFLERCVGCHGLAGDGKGPGAKFMSPAAGRLHRQGRRLLRRRHRARATSTTASCAAGRAPAMENFGDRLSVDDIWRVVLFVKTIPNTRSSPNVVPEPRDYIVWQPSKELLAWLKTHAEARPATRRSTRSRSADPFMKEAMRVFPGLAPGDSFCSTTAKTPLSLQTPPRAIKAIYQDLLEPRLGRAQARGEKLPPAAQKLIPPDRAGPAMRRLPARGRRRRASPRSRCRRLRSRTTQPENDQSSWVMADWMMDTFFIFSGLAFVAFLAAWKAGHFHELDKPGAIPLLVHEEDYYTPEWALDEEEWADGDAER